MGRAEDLFARLEDAGEAALDEFIRTRISEELYLDFKRSSDNGSGRRLSETDRNNLAKAISAFGNSEGGIVVWGVDCSTDAAGADVARVKVPLDDAPRYRSWLEGAVSGCTVPPHQGVRHLTIRSGHGESGYVVSLVPQSNTAPHQVTGRMVYYIRAGSDFVPAPHAVLAGMFGRRPQPHVFLSYTSAPARVEGDRIRFQIGFLIRNQGPGIATDLFVSLHITSTPGTNCTVELTRTEANNWGGSWSFGQHLSVICPPEFRLPPEAHVQPLVLDFAIAPPFRAPIEIKGIVGSAVSSPYRFHLFNTEENVAALYTSFTTRLAAGDDVSTESKDLPSSLLGIRE